MADPFSVAGSAVGVISLGISVCQGLVKSLSSITLYSKGKMTSNQLSTVESSNAVILENTATTRDISEVNWREVRGMREDIQRLIEVAVPALVLSSMRPQLQGNAGNAAATALNISSASRPPRASIERSIMGRESCYKLCRCRPRTKFIERLPELGPITLVRTRKSRVEHNEDCQYFVPKGHDEGAGLRLQVGTVPRRWNIMAALNYNHAVGAFSINPTLTFKATVPSDHGLFLITEDIVRGERSFEAGFRSIRLLFQNGEASLNDANHFGMNALLLALFTGTEMIEENISVDRALQERVRQLVLAFTALGVNVNVRRHGVHILDLYLHLLVVYISAHSDGFSFLYNLLQEISMHRDRDYDSVNYAQHFEIEPYTSADSYRMIEAVKKYDSLASELRFNNLCLAVLRKSLGDVESILSKSPSEISSTTPLNHTVLHLAADWPIGMATLLSRGGRSLVHTLDLAKQSPLEHACRYNCAPVVKLLLQADCYIDLDLMRGSEDQSKHLAETKLPVDRYRDLEIPVGHPMNDIKTAVVLAELQNNSIQIPQTMDYYGITVVYKRLWVNFFGSSFGNTIGEANIMYDAGFLLQQNVYMYQEVKLQLHGQCVRFQGPWWAPSANLAQRLEYVLWILGRGVAFLDLDLHNLFSPPYRWLSLEGIEDLASSHGGHLELLSQLLSSRSGIAHECPCCIDVCFPILAALRTGREAPFYDIDDPEGRTFIFEDLLGLVEACKIDFGSHFWVWVIPRLIHSILFEACCLTHSNGCCKRKWKSDEDDIKEKQEEEQHMRSRLNTLTEELTAEYQESSMLLSDFLRRRVVVRALELVDGEEEASLEDRKRLREIGVVLEEENDGDEIENDDIL